MRLGIQSPESDILKAAWHGAVIADSAEDGFARICALTGNAQENEMLAAAVAECLARKLIHDPIRLPEGGLHCHWTLELTEAGRIAARALTEK